MITIITTVPHDKIDKDPFPRDGLKFRLKCKRRSFLNHASIIPNLTAQSSELRGLGAPSRVVRERVSCGATDPGLSGVQNWTKLQWSVKGSQCTSMGLQIL